MKATRWVAVATVAALALRPATAAMKKASAAKTSQPAPKATLDAEARVALDRMSAYLRTLKAFEVVANGYPEDVLDSGQNVTIPGSLTYDVAKPDRLFAEVSSDRALRRYYFDGGKVTIDAPRHKLYTDAQLKGTIGTLLDVTYNKYGIELPLPSPLSMVPPGRQNNGSHIDRNRGRCVSGHGPCPCRGAPPVTAAAAPAG